MAEQGEPRIKPINHGKDYEREFNQWADWDRAIQQERDQGAYIVNEDDRSSIIAEAGQQKRIATGNLTGCEAIAVMLGWQGKREAYMQHYHRTHRVEGMQSFLDYLWRRKETGFDYARVVLMSAGGITHGSDFGVKLLEERIFPYYLDEIEEEIKFARTALGKNAIIQATPYKNNLRVPRTLIVDMPAEGGFEVISTNVNEETVIPEDLKTDISVWQERRAA